MSEGTPGRGPDADSRTDTGDGKVPTNGRPTPPPVRYGPRNGSPAAPANGRGAPGRTESGPSSPQQYRAPQPPRTPAGGDAKNGAGSGGAGSNGARPVTPSSYTRPRPSNVPARPEPSEQERLVADARIAAAARNSSAAKVRGGSALSGPRPPAPAEQKSSPADADPAVPVDETAVIPAVAAEERAVVAPSEPAAPGEPTTTTTEETPAPGKGRNRFARLRTRDRRPAEDAVVPLAAPVAAAAAAEAPAATGSDVETADKQAGTSAEPEPGAEPTTADSTAAEPAAAEAKVDSDREQDSATTERPLTWRDRLGLSPKEPKPQVADVPATDATTFAAGGAAAAVATTDTGTAPAQDRVTPSPFAPATTSDTVVIPAVDAAATGAPVPAAGATALPVVAPAVPKPKVGAARRTRKARLRLSRVDPWSVMKTALLFSIAAGIILVVATYGVWSVLNASGLFDAVNDMVKSVVSTPGDTTPFRIEEYVNTQKIIGVAALIAVVDVLIFTALATLGSFLYNLAATVLGGLEVTLAED